MNSINKSINNSISNAKKDFKNLDNIEIFVIVLFILNVIGFYNNYNNFDAIVFMCIMAILIYLFSNNIFYSLLISIICANLFISLNVFKNLRREGLLEGKEQPEKSTSEKESTSDKVFDGKDGLEKLIAKNSEPDSKSAPEHDSNSDSDSDSDSDSGSDSD